jgi:hypothetical protein
MSKRRITAGPSLAERMKTAIADHVAQREDIRGFSRLDALIGEIEVMRGERHSEIESALLRLLPDFENAQPPVWEAVRMLIDAAKLRSNALASCIMKTLDKFSEPNEPATRFEALLAYRAAGGAITRPRLDREKRLHDEMTPLWVDLALSAYVGAPESVISLLEEQLRDRAGSFTWKDVRRRLPLIFRLLRSRFNRGIVRVISAIPSIDGQKELAAAVKFSFKIDPLSELESINETEAIEFKLASIRRQRTERSVSSQEKMREAFGPIVPAALIALKARTTEAGHDANQI